MVCKSLFCCGVWGSFDFGMGTTDLRGVCLDIRFLDATEEGGHSLSTEKFIGEIP